MLPLLRVLPLGALLTSVVIFALAATPPAPRLLHTPAPARGPLIDTNEHPEWRQFLLQAAYRRADEIGQLRLLPNRPTIVPAMHDIKPATVKEQAPASEPAPPKEAAAIPDPVLPPIDVPEADYVKVAEALPLPRAGDLAPPAPPVVAFPVLPMPPLPDEPVFFADVPLPPLSPPHTIAQPPVPLARPLTLAGLQPGPQAGGSEDITGTIESPAMATLPVEIGEASSTELPVLLHQRPPLPRAAPQPRVSRPARHYSRVRRAAAKPARPAQPVKPATPAPQPDLFQSLFGNDAQSAIR